MTEILTAIGTVLGIAATLFLRDYRDGKNIFTKNIPPNTLDEGFKYMKHHYNDELTAILTELQVNQKEGFRDINGSLKEISTMLTRIDAGGVKIRS